MYDISHKQSTPKISDFENLFILLKVKQTIPIWLCFCLVFVLYEIKMENKKKKNFLSNWDFFLLNWEKTILFGIGNGAEFRPQNRVIKSPETSVYFWKMTISNISVKPEICMCQMTPETILSCVRLQNNASMAQKTQPWQNTGNSSIYFEQKCR